MLDIDKVPANRLYAVAEAEVIRVRQMLANPDALLTTLEREALERQADAVEAVMFAAVLDAADHEGDEELLPTFDGDTFPAEWQ